MKKGDVSITVFIAGIIAFFLILVVVIYLAGPGQDTFNRLKLLLPSFNRTVETQNPSLIVGYNVGQDKPKWYDGVEWHDFSEDLEINNQKISGDQVNYYLKEFWNKGKRKDLTEVQGTLTIQETAKVAEWYAPKEGKNCIPSKIKFDKPILYTVGPSGAVVANLRDLNYPKNRIDFGLMQVTLTNEVKYFKTIFKKDQSGNVVCESESRENDPKPLDPNPQKDKLLYDKIANSLIAWRDSVFENPALFKYGDEKTEYYFCVQKFAGKDFQGNPTQILAIELNKEKKPNESCK